METEQFMSAEELQKNLPMYLKKTEEDLARLAEYSGTDKKWVQDISKNIDNNFILICGSIPIFMAYQEITGGLKKDIYDKTSSLLQKACEIFKKYVCLDILTEKCAGRLNYLEEAIITFPNSLIKNH